jgi:hypothetical protein
MPELNDKDLPEFDPDDDDDPVLVKFPSDSLRMPEPLLPRPIGRISSGHPLIKPLLIFLAIFVIVVAVILVISLRQSMVSGTHGNPQQSIGADYREDGAIDYHDARIHGWYLDREHEHFMDTSGKRYTYVNQYRRENTVVPGYWRLIE